MISLDGMSAVAVVETIFPATPGLSSAINNPLTVVSR